MDYEKAWKELRKTMKRTKILSKVSPLGIIEGKLDVKKLVDKITDNVLDEMDRIENKFMDL